VLHVQFECTTDSISSLLVSFIALEVYKEGQIRLRHTKRYLTFLHALLLSPLAVSLLSCIIFLFLLRRVPHRI
jgi:hypothetical protein